jgi:TonB family protein
MGDPPLPVSSIPGAASRASSARPKDVMSTVETQAPDSLAVIDVIRQSAEDGTRSTDSILAAIADAARALGGADGTAIALRTNDLIVCRARSGDMAPPLGVPLNTDSGISGECLRTASTLVCEDAATDERVDADACRSLGIRSLVVVPLRSRTGMIGILEAFSARPRAFQKEQIDALRSLAEIAENSYERERQAAATATSASTTRRTALFTPAAILPRDGSDAQWYAPFLTKRYLVIGAAALAILLIALVIRLNWRSSGTNVAGTRSPAQAQGSAPIATAKPTADLTPQKNVLAKTVRPADRGQTKNPLQNAAEIQPAEKSVNSGASAPSSKTPEKTDPTVRSTPASAEASSESPPAIELVDTGDPNELLRMASGEAKLPTLGAPVSQGVVPATLVQKVDPIYPPRARSERVAGPVTLEATVAENGTIKGIKFVSGPPALANAAITAVRQWRYKPATLNGKPIEAPKRITLIFRLP